MYFTTIDPAIEVGDSNDYTAVLTCAIDSSENIYVVETINKRMLPSETVDCLFDTFKRWNSSGVAIETLGFQKMLKYDIERERKRRRSYPRIIELKSGGRRKGLRIEALQPWFESGKIFIKQDQKELKSQLLSFPSTRSHDDIIDALAYQLDIIQPSQKEVESINPECFAAYMARRHNKKHALQWGNHSLRTGL